MAGRKSLITGVFLAAALLAGRCDVAYAQEEAAVNAPFSFDAYGAYVYPGGIRNGQGRISLSQARASARLEKKAWGKMPVSVSLSAEEIGIHGPSVVPLPSHLNAISLDMQAYLPVPRHDALALGVGFTPSLRNDDWQVRGGEVRLFSRYFLAYRPDPRWTWIGGVAVFPEYKTPVLPLAGCIYRPNDQWEFYLVPPAPAVTYSFNRKASLSLTGDISFNGEYEVTRDGERGVALRYAENKAGLAFNYRITPKARFSLCGGWVFGRLIEYRDGQGKAGIKPGYYNGAQCTIQM